MTDCSIHYFFTISKPVNKILKETDFKCKLKGRFSQTGGKKTLVWKDTCTPMFAAALFTIAKIWKQPKCPSTDKWIKKMWDTHTHTIEYYSAIKKNEILQFVPTWIDLENIMLSEISQTNTLWYHLHVESKNQNKSII